MSYIPEQMVVTVTVKRDTNWNSDDTETVYSILEGAAKVFGRGKSNISETTVSYKRTKWAKEINEKILPTLFQRIDEILSPEKSVKE